MKTIICTILIIFSYTQLTAQEISSVEPNKVTINKTKSTKTDFYETLIATNNFDIQIKKNDNVVVKTKNEFYNNLMIKNGFTVDTKENTRLANSTIKNRDSILNDTTQISGLLP